MKTPRKRRAGGGGIRSEDRSPLEGGRLGLMSRVIVRATELTKQNPPCEKRPYKAGRIDTELITSRTRSSNGEVMAAC